MNAAAGGLLVAEVAAEVGDERIHRDALERLRVAMVGVELAASLGVTGILPVGGLVAGADEGWLLDEGFQEHGAIALTRVPVLG